MELVDAVKGRRVFENIKKMPPREVLDEILRNSLYYKDFF
jgi:hypothetical protein